MTKSLLHRLRYLSRLDIALGVAALVALGVAVLGTAVRAPFNRVPGIDAGTLVVADLRGHALTFLDLRSGGSRRIALEGGPHELVQLADGRLAVSLEQAGRLALVDPASGRVDYLDTGGLPHGVALNGGTLLVTDRASASVRRFDVSTWIEGAPVDGGALPHQVAVLGGGLLVADASSGQLHLGTGRGVPQPALTESIAVSSDGARVAVAGAADGRVLVYELDTVGGGERVRDLLLGGRPVRVMFDAHSASLAVALSASGELALIDRAGAPRRVAVGGVPDGLVFSPDGSVVFVSDMAGGRVCAVEVATGRVVARLDGGETAGALAFVE